MWYRSSLILSPPRTTAIAQDFLHFLKERRSSHSGPSAEVAIRAVETMRDALSQVSYGRILSRWWRWLLQWRAGVMVVVDVAVVHVARVVCEWSE